MSASLVVVLIGLVLVFVSALFSTPSIKGRAVNLWYLGWGFILTGVLLLR